MQMKLLFLVGVFALVLVNCKKKEQEQIPSPSPIYRFYPVSNELKYYGLFKVGSYWIYRIDTASALTDSVYVKSVSTNTFITWKNEDSIVVGEKITINFGYNPDFGNRFYSAFILSSYPYQTISAPNFANQIPFIIFELDSLNIASTYGNGMVENSSVSNYLLNGINYGNCRFLKYAWKYYRPSSPELWYLSSCYWKRNVGLVKNASMFVYNTCELLRYSVVQ